MIIILCIYIAKIYYKITFFYSYWEVITIFEIRTQEQNRLHIIAIKGKLDVSTAQQAKIEILDKMTSSDNIIIDMSDCNYISNYGLYLLSNIVNKAKLLNIKAIFVSLIDKISEIFDLTGLTDTIELAPSIDDAIKEYALIQ